jgi:hypothetical protein
MLQVLVSRPAATLQQLSLPPPLLSSDLEEKPPAPRDIDPLRVVGVAEAEGRTTARTRSARRQHSSAMQGKRERRDMMQQKRTQGFRRRTGRSSRELSHEAPEVECNG